MRLYFPCQHPHTELKAIFFLLADGKVKNACIVFFEVVDAIGGACFDDGVGGDNEVQRTMLEIVNQLDGFDARGNIKVLMATNRPDTLDPALLRPGRLDRKVEFGLPDLESRTQIFKIHTRTMNCERDIRFELLACLCPNSTGAGIRSVCTEAGMYAIRARRKTVTEKDFPDAMNKVIKGMPEVQCYSQIYGLQLGIVHVKLPGYSLQWHMDRMIMVPSGLNMCSFSETGCCSMFLSSYRHDQKFFILPDCFLGIHNFILFCGGL
ncbi:26S proteasome regulatory subunit 7-like protein [Drosera capensis]